MKLPLLLLFFAFLVSACQVENRAEKSNIARDRFDAGNSDPAGIELADSIMSAAGGRENWDKTRFFSWNDSGERNLYWDKQMGRARVEDIRDETVYLLNLNNGSGRVKVKSQEITNPDSLQKSLKKGRSILIDDIYGLVLPFKLKDSGVTLKYMGEDTLKGNRYNILEMTFPKVENELQGKYKIYVDVKAKVVKYWSYYRDVNQATPTFIKPWGNYQQYGSILLSADGSANGGPRKVKIEETVPEKLFTEF